MHKLSAIIVHEEPSEQAAHESLFSSVPLLRVVEGFNSVEEAGQAVIFSKPDVVFLDFTGQGKHCREFLQRNKVLNPQLPVICLTDYNEKLVRSFREQGITWLPKPVDRNDLCILLLTIIRMKQMETRAPRKISVPVKSGLAFFRKDQILLLRAEGKHTTIELSTGKKQTSSSNLGKLLTSIPADGFLRVNRSTVINTDHLRNINRKGKYCLLGDEEQSLRVPLSNLFLQRISQPLK